MLSGRWFWEQNLSCVLISSLKVKVVLQTGKDSMLMWSSVWLETLLLQGSCLGLSWLAPDLDFLQLWEVPLPWQEHSPLSHFPKPCLALPVYCHLSLGLLFASNCSTIRRSSRLKEYRLRHHFFRWVHLGNTSCQAPHLLRAMGTKMIKSQFLFISSVSSSGGNQ